MRKEQSVTRVQPTAQIGVIIDQGFANDSLSSLLRISISNPELVTKTGIAGVISVVVNCSAYLTCQLHIISNAGDYLFVMRSALKSSLLCKHAPTGVPSR
jgi:hypothetical protein